MAERQQRVVGVLAVGVVVGPGAEEAAAIGPQRVDEIEARLAEAGRCGTCSADSAWSAVAVDSRSGIGASGEAKKPPRGMAAIEQPHAGVAIRAPRPAAASP